MIVAKGAISGKYIEWQDQQTPFLLKYPVLNVVIQKFLHDLCCQEEGKRGVSTSL
jgi:hypothetical protein